jgi:SAM-dependent methyltransferase
VEPYAQPGFLERLRSHAREEGAAAVARRLAAWAGGLAFPPRGGFELGGERYSFARRVHGLTWTTERAVEVPVAQRVVARSREKRILEVGNVLSHYGPVTHDVVDKYERAPGVRNVDVLDLPAQPDYDLIVSVSTLEHVGRDEEPRDPARAIRALDHLRGLLAPGGELFATVPAGYNPELDAALADGAYELRAMRRRPWREVEPAEAFQCRYDFLVYSASAVLFVHAEPLP